MKTFLVETLLNLVIYVLKSFIIHQVKTKEIITVTMVWKYDETLSRNVHSKNTKAPFPIYYIYYCRK